MLNLIKDTTEEYFSKKVIEKIRLLPMVKDLLLIIAQVSSIPTPIEPLILDIKLQPNKINPVGKTESTN